MSKQPPSSGRFGHPILDKILQGLAKQAQAQADASRAQAQAMPSEHDALTTSAFNSLMGHTPEQAAFSELFVRAMTQMRAAPMSDPFWVRDAGPRGATRATPSPLGDLPRKSRAPR